MVSIKEMSSDIGFPPRKRLRQGHPSGGFGAFGLAFVLVASAWLSGCDSASDGLAPYEGDRPYVLLRVTQNVTPDVQWVGGRAAAVGVNRGEHPALDSSLVWIVRSDNVDISSHVTVGDGGDSEFVRTVGGEPLEALEDGVPYTFWVADDRALAAGLDTTELDQHSLVDTTLALQLVLQGRSGGDPDLPISNLRVIRRETLEQERLLIEWDPTDFPVRQIGIRAGSTGGFSDLIWHVVLPDDDPDSITPPVEIGILPEGALEAIPYAGFSPATHTLWMTNSDWDGGFTLRSQGYSFYQMFAANFPE